MLLHLRFLSFKSVKHFVMAAFEVEILPIQSWSRNRFLKHKTTTHHTFLKVSVVFVKKSSNHEF